MRLLVASGGPIFSLAREKIGEKRVLGRVWCMLRLNFGGTNVSGAVPLDTHSTSFCCAPPDTGVSDLQLVALERLLSIEGADEIRIDVTFLRGKAPLPGELSAKLTERLHQICHDLSVSASPSHLPFQGRLGNCALQWLPL